jgi:hypothetical protein
MDSNRADDVTRGGEGALAPAYLAAIVESSDDAISPRTSTASFNQPMRALNESLGTRPPN